MGLDMSSDGMATSGWYAIFSGHGPSSAMAIGKSLFSLTESDLPSINIRLYLSYSRQFLMPPAAKTQELFSLLIDVHGQQCPVSVILHDKFFKKVLHLI